MFKRVVGYKGFWKTVLFMSLGYAVILFLVQWASIKFSSEMFTTWHGLKYILMLIPAGFIAGFMVSYGMFWGKLKKEDYRK